MASQAVPALARCLASWSQQAGFPASFEFHCSDHGASDRWGLLWTVSCDAHLKGCLPQPGCLGLSSGGPEPVPLRPHVRTVPTACWGCSGSCWAAVGEALSPAYTWPVGVPCSQRASLPALPLGADPACPWGPVRWPQVPAIGTPAPAGCGPVAGLAFLWSRCSRFK